MNRKYDGLEIAIIGISGQFPGSNDFRHFWENIADGKELIKTFTDEELKDRGMSESEISHPLFVKSAGVVENKNHFDHAFFGYTAEEAAFMDPQTRLFHEHCWKALDDAGYSSAIDRQKIGLFAGASKNYHWKAHVLSRSQEAKVDGFFLDMISGSNFVNTLVSYKLNLRGASCFIDTACSTSLVAVHYACRSLLTRECSIALAGGVSIGAGRRKGYYYQEGMINAVDGHVKTFDKDASGCVSGEGVGVVVLKRLNEAIKDRDHIYAIIKATSVNNDGNQKVGFTAPGIKGQAECIRMAHKVAGISPKSISYIEAHGTATKLGDPVEIKALNEAFDTGGDQKFCAIGSVKTNIGHLDAAAGVTGLIKTALSLYHKKIPPSLHFKEPNPEIDFASGPFYVNARLQEWKGTSNAPLRAGVSSFGIGGTNAHVILEEAPEAEPVDEGRKYKIATLTAKTAQGLGRYAEALKTFLLKEPELDLAGMSYTLGVGRKHFNHRRSIVYSSREELLKLLDAKSNDHSATGKEQTKQAVFMFPGQGSQYVNMGKDLYEQEPLFRETMDKGLALLQKVTGEDLKEIIYPQYETKENLITETRYAQPLISLLEYSIAQMLIALGIKPACMIGHSIGEYVAACISGLFDLEDALRLIVKRGALMNALPPGDMVSVMMTEQEAAVYITKEISLAAINGPKQVVFSGNAQAVAGLLIKLDETNIPYVKLNTSHAFHSVMQESILEEYKKEVAKVNFHPMQYPFISNLTGVAITAEQAANPAYWVNHLRHTVRYSDGIKSLLQKSDEFLFIEVGAGHTLSNLLKQQNAKQPASVTLVRSEKEPADDGCYFTASLGRLWERGMNIDWLAYYKTEQRNKISLPPYSFEPTRHIAEVEPFENGLGEASKVLYPTKNETLSDWLYFPVWKSAVITPSADQQPGTILLFSSGDPFAVLLKEHLLQSGNRVIEVLMGEHYLKTAGELYYIHPVDNSHFRKLFGDIRANGIVVSDIVYAWTIACGTSIPEMKADDRSLHLAYFSIAFIVQSLVQLELLHNTKITIVTDSLHMVTGNEKGLYTQAPALSFVNTLAQEYGMSCYNIDVNLQEDPKQVVKDIVTEIVNDNKDHVVAWRYGKRWLQDYERNKIPVNEKEGLVRAGGVYVITGGTGNVGFALARYLAAREVKLVIIGRKKIEAASGTEVWLQRLQHLQQINEEVKYYSLDVADQEAFSQAVQQITREVGTINGIIHAAGYINDDHFETVEDITPEKSLALFRAKIAGILNLYELFGNADVDFVWITSSLSSIVGGLGFSSYAAANLFMDHFVTARIKELPNWKCVGLSEMLFTEEDMQQEREGSRKALKTTELSALFAWSISLKNTPVIFETIDSLPNRIQRVFESPERIYLDAGFTGENKTPAARPELSNDYVAPSTKTETAMVTIICDFFGIEQIGVTDNYFELGGDSLKAMILLKKIKTTFGVHLSLKDFFALQNIQKMAAEIDERSWINKSSEKNFVSII